MPSPTAQLAAALAPALHTALTEAGFAGLPEALLVPTYPGDPAEAPSPKVAPISAVYASVEALARALEERSPGAVEASLLLLGGVTPARVEAIALQALGEGAWPRLQISVCRVLGRCGSEASFCALLSLLAREPAAGYELKQNTYPGAALALERLATHPALSLDPNATYTPHERMEAQHLLSYLGRRPEEPEVARRTARLLCQVYGEHPSRPLRLAAGHALVERGEPDGLALLIEREDATDDVGRLFAVKALMALDPPTAYERLAPRLSEKPLREQVLRLLLNESQAASKADPARGWIPTDSGFLPWLTELRADRALGQTAQGILKAYRGALPTPKPKAASKRRAQGATQALKQATARYLAAPSAGTWAALAEATRGAPLSPAAIAIAAPAATLLVQRAFGCLERIHRLLDEAGYRFVEAEPLAKAPSDIGAQLSELEAQLGPLPLVLHAWLTQVGHADLRGGGVAAWGLTHTSLMPQAAASQVILADPWVCSSAREALDALDTWDNTQAFEWPLSPDAVSKAGLSGGAVLLRVEGPTLDARCSDAPGRSFAELLRLSLTAGGFPGLQLAGEPEPLLASLRKAYLEF